MLIGDLDGCLDTAAAVIEIGYLTDRAQAALLTGIAALRKGQNDGAKASFTRALAHTDRQLGQTPDAYQALDTRALALCGLAVTGASTTLGDAIDTFGVARRITSAAGIVARVLQTLETIAAADPASVLDTAKVAAEGPHQRQ